MCRHVVAVVVLALVAVGCGGPSDREETVGQGVPRGPIVGPVVAPVDPPADQPGPTPTEPDGKSSHPNGAAGPASPRPDGDGQLEAAATGELLDRFEDEGLSVLSVDVEVTDRGTRRATVVVTVLYGTGRSHPHQGRYRVQFRATDDSWTVMSVRAAA